MKILFLGQIGSGQTSLMRMRALERLRHEVCGVHTIQPWRQASWLNRQIQRRLECGSIVTEINKSALQAARQFRPDLVWAEKQEFLHAETVYEMRKLGAKCVHFTPDPYFSLEWKRTRIMDKALREFDALVYCKCYEKVHYRALGKPLVYMPLGYCDENHRPLASDDEQWACDIGFLGGWEPRRERMLRAVALTGANVKFRGGYWDFLTDGKWTFRRRIILGQLAAGEPVKMHRDKLLAAHYQGGEVYSDDYARALSGAKIGLGFLRTAWPDQHTTRTFEIPACGSMLLADRTDEHLEFFAEGKEAEFFASTEELLDKVTFYRANESARKRVAEQGYRRCTGSDYSYFHRLNAALVAISKN